MRAAALCLLLVLSCAAPEHDHKSKHDHGTKYDHTPEQIAAEVDFEVLMHVQETVAEPRFELAQSLDAATMSENDFEQFIDMGHRLRLTAKRIAEISKTDFGGLDKQLTAEAAALEKFARALDAANTLKAVRSVKKTCAACHAQYR